MIDPEEIDLFEANEDVELVYEPEVGNPDSKPRVDHYIAKTLPF